MTWGEWVLRGSALVLGFALGAVLVLALGRHRDAWYFEWRLAMGRSSDRQPPQRPTGAPGSPRSDEAGSPGVTTADDQPGAAQRP